jgi:hypothetical protein
MRLSALSLFIAAIGLLAIPLAPARAVPAAAAITNAGPPAAFVEVRGGCGRGWHRVPGHRNRYGRWVPPHCARNWR